MSLEKLFQLDKGQLKELKQAVDAGRSTAVFYASEYNRYHIASQLGRPFLYVVGDIVSARRAFDALSEYSDGEILLMPDREDPLILRKSVNYTLLQERLRVLNALIDNTVAGVVITAENFVQLYPKPEYFYGNRFTLKTGETTDTGLCFASLATMGYKRTEFVSAPAEFAVRGDVLDIFPLGFAFPVRISFFGDEVEDVKSFDIETMQYKESLSEVTITPATDIIIPEESIKGILNAVKRDAKSANININEKFADEIERLVACPSSPLNNFFLPYIREYVCGISDYLAEGGVIVFDDSGQAEDKIKLLKNRVNQRVDALKASGAALSSHKKCILDLDCVIDDSHVKLGFGRITRNVNIFRPQEVLSIKANALPPFYNDMQGFFAQVKNMESMGARIVVACKDEGALESLRASFNDEFIGCYEGENRGGVSLRVARINRGFIYPAEKIMLVGIGDLTGKAERKRSDRAKRVVFEIPAEGDYVVHEKHGIGISEGIRRIKTPSGEKDYYVVLYRDGDRLYLPCDKLDTIEKYTGGDKPALHKLGGAEFERVKKRVKESVKKLTIDLLSLYRSRYNKKGHVYQPDTVWQKEMEEDFPYTETDDQLIAVNEIKSDMESGKIMDRLLCGDVGYGKTEVAMRAIFKTVIEGKQAAVLAPTTILAQQHYNLMKARFNKFKLNIELLSRFVSPAEIKKSLERIEKGESNIIVATHRILGKDVKFADLGLLVLDEEQRFGVEHKEKLKQYRDDVNILSLSATPIPRTLHMALSGIRDISTLENPPKNRMPVETYVTEYSDVLLCDAVNKELMRNGQVFILYNRVQTIDSFYKKVRELLPDVKIVVAHGQMDEELLEDRIREFYENRAQVLISTTIIENGIDLPNANTLFVVNSERLGLSQLYQLRGRVGRSDVPAYAYFTVPEGAVLTSSATQRLEALMDNTDLGSGFRIAMRDLEIRGAGNVLGREQHGQMEKVGYEMYLKLIKEGIDEAQGITTEELRDVEMKVDADYALDEKYIPDAKGRVAFYKKVSALTTISDGQYYYDSLKKNYGAPPECIKTIIRCAIIKNKARQLGVSRVVISEKSGLYFYDSRILGDEKLFVAMDAMRRYAVLSPTSPPVVIFNTTTLAPERRVKLVLEFLDKATS